THLEETKYQYQTNRLSQPLTVKTLTTVLELMFYTVAYQSHQQMIATVPGLVVELCGQRKVQKRGTGEMLPLWVLQLGHDKTHMSDKCYRCEECFKTYRRKTNLSTREDFT
ncbi:hypothetical protein DPMN_073966, partial [Dreissena polymorpha]